MKECWILSNPFWAPNGIILYFFFHFDYMADYIDGFSYTELSLHPSDEGYLIIIGNVFGVVREHLG